MGARKQKEKCKQTVHYIRDSIFWNAIFNEPEHKPKVNNKFIHIKGLKSLNSSYQNVNIIYAKSLSQLPDIQYQYQYMTN